MTDAWFEATADLLYRTQQTRGDQLPVAVTAAMRRLGVRTTLFLVDQEQQMLRMLPQAGAAMVDPMPVEGTLAGRAFSLVETVTGRDGADWRLWVPLLDGTDRLGVMEIRPLEPAPPPDPEQCGRYELLANLIGHLTVIHLPHGDMLVQARRSRPMSVTSELLWRLLPPLTFTCQEMVISAVLEPCYEVGGDAFDYAVDGSLARMAILDATGHDLSAGVTCSVGLAAIRATRRDGGGLCAMGRAVDAAIASQFADARFATAVLAELDLASGRLRYVNAGHPPPLLIRDGKVVRTLDGGRRLPLGVADAGVDVAEELLQPGDRLLMYTDGVTEAHDSAGNVFGLDRLTDHAERNAAAGLPAPESLRRLSNAVRRHQYGELHDDATLLLMEWSSAAVERTLP